MFSIRVYTDRLGITNKDNAQNEKVVVNAISVDRIFSSILMCCLQRLLRS